MESRTTTVVLIEYQNDFTWPSGPVRRRETGHGADGNARQHDRHRRARACARRDDRLCADHVHRQLRELSDRPYGILKGVVDSKSFRKGMWGAEIVDELTPAEQEIVVEGKRGLDAFASTNLDFILRSRGITTITLGGFLTNCCVESTIVTVYEKGYDVYTLTDCTATVSGDEQPRRRKNFPMFSRPVPHVTFLEELGA